MNSPFQYQRKYKENRRENMENDFRVKRVIFNKLHSKLNFFRVTVWQPQIKKGWQKKRLGSITTY